MKLLALDTATENCSAALLIDATLQTRQVEMERGHAERILPMVDELLTAAGIALQDLDAIAFGRGPGSFTGVRLGTTVTQGLAFGAGLGVVPISDLQAVAQRVLDEDPASTRILVCNDARMSEVYWASYERGPDGLARLEGEERVSKPGEVKLPPGWVTATAAGRGFVAYGEALRAAVPSVPFTLNAHAHLPDPIHYLPRATEIARLAVPSVRAGRLLNAEEALPVYLRDNVAHVAKPSAKPHGHTS
jgi:tRNA threonylcarbamoyladenosine biosynthesis protein TsaB